MAMRCRKKDEKESCSERSRGRRSTRLTPRRASRRHQRRRPHVNRFTEGRRQCKGQPRRGCHVSKLALPC